MDNEEKKLGVVSLTALVTGNMIGAGNFFIAVRDGASGQPEFGFLDIHYTRVVIFGVRLFPDERHDSQDRRALCLCTCRPGQRAWVSNRLLLLD